MIWLAIISSFFLLGSVLVLALCVAAGRAERAAEADARALAAASAQVRERRRQVVTRSATLTALAQATQTRLCAERVGIYAVDTTDGSLVLVAAGDPATARDGVELRELGEACLESGSLLVTNGVAQIERPLAVANAVPLTVDDVPVGALVATWSAPGHPYSTVARSVVGETSRRAASLLADRRGRFTRTPEVMPHG
jgi:hypothetical protein